MLEHSRRTVAEEVRVDSPMIRRTFLVSDSQTQKMSRDSWRSMAIRVVHFQPKCQLLHFKRCKFVCETFHRLRYKDVVFRGWEENQLWDTNFRKQQKPRPQVGHMTGRNRNLCFGLSSAKLLIFSQVVLGKGTIENLS